MTNVCGIGCMCGLGLSKHGTLKLGIMTGGEAVAVDRECEGCCRLSDGCEPCMWNARGDLNALVSGELVFKEFSEVISLQGVMLGDDCMWLLALMLSKPLEETVSQSACSSQWVRCAKSSFISLDSATLSP